MKIILQIHSDSRFTWIQLGESAEVVMRQEYQTLAGLPEVPTKTGLMVLVSGEEVLLTKIKMPKMNRHELLKAVPYALEEQLAADIDRLCFSIGEDDGQGDLSVAVMDRLKFEGYLNELKTHGLAPDAILPDYLSIPVENNAWTVCIKTHRALVRTGNQAGFATSHDNLALLLEWMLGQCADLPSAIRVVDPSKCYPIEKLEVLKNRIGVECIECDEKWEWSGLMNPPPINLLQGIYRSKSKPTKIKRYWKMTAITGVVLLVLSLGGRAVELHYLKAHTQQLQQKINTTYRHIFPGATSTIEPRFRIQRELNNLTQSSRASQFMNLLGRAASILHQYPGVKLKSLSYQHKQLTLQLQGGKLTQRQALTRVLSRQGVKVNKND